MTWPRRSKPGTGLGRATAETLFSVTSQKTLDRSRGTTRRALQQLPQKALGTGMRQVTPREHTNIYFYN